MEDLDALLIDLQNSVPGKHQNATSEFKSVENHKSGREQCYCTSSYGILNEQTGSQTDYDTQVAIISPLSKICTQNYKTEDKIEIIQTCSNDSKSEITRGGSLAQLQVKGYTKNYRSTDLSELDSLLEDLGNARYDFQWQKGHIFQVRDELASRSTSKNIYASSAAKELDDLMASLSNIKLNSGSHHHQTITDYAKPIKGISYLTKNILKASTIVENSVIDHLDCMLGSLQANMSRQGVNTIQKGCCNACEKPIVGQVITALGKTWHPEHFTCNHCNQELGTRNFFERDGYPYCEPDYHNLFSPRCAYCSGAILDKCVTALDKTWHTEHFFCAQCGQQFGEDGFHERDGKPYCRNDYFEMFAPKCNGCNRAIMENYISALNSQWHPDCFVCRDCKNAVRGKSFYAMEGKPVCPTCVGVQEEE